VGVGIGRGARYVDRFCVEAAREPYSSFATMLPYRDQVDYYAKAVMDLWLEGARIWRCIEAMCLLSELEIERSMMTQIVQYKSEHFSGVEALWKEAFPNDTTWNVAAVAIPEKVRVQPDLFLVALNGSLTVGSVMAGYDGHRGWISRIAVLKSHRDQGIGRLLLAEAERRLANLGCIKVNLQVVDANADVVKFYQRLGYGVEPRISMSKHLRPVDIG
jgi:ribosomal protein S18 acetylase RimI-like enzyme